jgi:predicted transcriptional regulator
LVRHLFVAEGSKVFNHKMKQRDNFALTTLILLALRQMPLTKRELMQQLLLSYSNIKSYGKRLAGENLVNYDPVTERYSITSKGFQILLLNVELASFLPELHEVVKRYHIYEQDNNEGYYDMQKGAKYGDSNLFPLQH